MKKLAFFILLLFAAVISFAQHCPWDCAGLIQVQTSVSKATVYTMKPVLVDEDKNVITDTIYGTGKDTYDLCEFLYYDDFMKYRKKKIPVHHWYQYDTVYHFAKGKYIVHYNFCKYQDKKLFLRYIDPSSASKAYRYVEIPGSKRIHLHDYNTELRQDETASLIQATKEFVMPIDCKGWGLTTKDCR